MAKTKTSQQGKRGLLTLSLASHTIARLQSLALVSPLSRGKIVDLALDCVDACEPCAASGIVDGRPCRACVGTGIVPTTKGGDS